MFSQSLFVFVLAATASVDGLPLFKRINQETSASKAKWEAACIAAGGGQQCNPIAVTAASTLLAGAGDCEQQDSADAMIDLAKTLSGDTTEMNQLAQIFAQQPRNTLTGESVPYCQTAPKNSELNGLFQCQFEGTSAKDTFKGGVAIGEPGTIPLGQNAPLDPAGSCPANPDGPIPDGQQLVDLVQSPGTPAASEGAASDNVNEDDNTNTNDAASANNAASGNGAVTANSSETAEIDAGPAANFKAQNGQDAQDLNEQFASLTADSACTDGDQACVGDSFAQCVGGKFALTRCAGGTVCKALPLVNKPGTSITCTTEADAEARIATALGTSGGAADKGGAANNAATNNAATNNAAANNAAANNAAADDAPASGGANFKAQNGQDAQDLNDSFANLSADSACQDNEQACVDGSFAQCVNGKFALTSCAGGTVCKALPLVNKPGTSLTCTTEDDAEARIATALGSA